MQKNLCWIFLAGVACHAIAVSRLDRTRLSAAEPAVGLQHFIPVDTSRLMGSPDPIPSMETEVAFPRLTIDRPVQPTCAGDGSGRMFVVTQRGLIYVFPNRSDVSEAQVFLDIQDAVSPGLGDNGMFCAAFHPQYGENGQFFVVYTTRALPRSTIVSRFSVSRSDRNRAKRESEEVLLNIRQPLPDHNAACLQFGPDEYLYIALGDGGYHAENGHAQDLSSLLGKMLRIDVDRKNDLLPYAIPPDNPFVGRENVRAEIWAYGLRAPWRFSFDRVTGDCWLGDNGQNVLEEIDLIVRGGNYGWIEREGSQLFDPSTVVLNAQQQRVRSRAVLPARRPLGAGDPDLHDPVFEYSHAEGKSVVGGIVYRGKRLPQLVGTYLYADHIVGKIWALRWNGKQVTENRLVANTRQKITSFGEDEDGELYFTAFDGRIYRLRPTEQGDEKPAFPSRLSETGLFQSVADIRPVEGLIPYSVNVPLWSDHATKERFLALPKDGKVIFNEHDSWEFPVGAVFVKHFSLELTRDQPHTRKRLETRLLVHSSRGWDGYTYRWNEEETDAFLLGGSATETYDVRTETGRLRQTWYFPSRTDCITCHPRSSGFVLGANTRQLNRLQEDCSLEFVENQLRSLERKGIFVEPLPKPPESLPAFPDWPSQTGSMEARARAYLDVNCAMCHTPPGYTKIDLRVQTPLELMHLLGQEPEKPRVGRADSRLIAIGHPDRSELFLRLIRRGPGQMPNLATTLVDEHATHVIAEWIRSLSPTDR